ncbi:MAG: hypothetical protein HOF19_07495 [Gammaproteobacteria bacterium]|nr:hypothetical protein [Gammaproteobacteria bacterium]
MGCQRYHGRTAAAGYAVGDFGINLYFISVMTYLLYFYTDVLGISAVAASGVFFVARIIDAVTDPLMGAIAERTRTRYGRMRPYLLFGALPLGLISILTFTVPDLDGNGKLVWAYTTYILFGIIYTVVTIPYATLTASITSDYDGRTRLSTYRIACAFTGGVAVSVFTMPFVSMFESEAQGFQVLMALFSIVATVLLFVTFKTTEEVVQPTVTKKYPLLRALKQFSKTHRSWWSSAFSAAACCLSRFASRRQPTSLYTTSVIRASSPASFRNLPRRLVVRVQR